MRIGKIKLFEKTVIAAEAPDGPLLIRWILVRFPGYGIYLHKLCRSDYDRALHDHPWPFVSIVLKNGYHEVHDQTVDEQLITVWHAPGSVLFRPAEWRHRVVIRPGKPAWTLILVGRRCRRWGFHLPTGWCWWRMHDPVKGICEEEVLWKTGSD